MKRIIKPAILLLCVTLFACHKDEMLGNQHIRCFEKTSLQLKSDATTFEVKGYIIPIERIEIDGKIYENSWVDVIYRNGLGHKELCDTMTVEWIKVWRTNGNRLVLKPQSNTTGAERSLTVYLWEMVPGYYNTSLEVTQPSE
jgi:hypothetical protein